MSLKKPCTITLARVMRAIENDEFTGFCVACGKKAYGVEPDARKRTCQSCGEPRVYGAEELLMHLAS